MQCLVQSLGACPATGGGSASSTAGDNDAAEEEEMQIHVQRRPKNASKAFKNILSIQ